MFPHLRSVCFSFITTATPRQVARVIGGFAFCSFLLTGCSKESEPMGIVLGVVKVQGESPTDNLRLSFFDPMTGHGAGGRTESDGSFRIRRPLPVGNYKMLVDRVIPEDPAAGSGNQTEMRIDTAYFNDITTPLAFDVVSGENKFEIDLQGPPAKKPSRR